MLRSTTVVSTRILRPCTTFWACGICTIHSWICWITAGPSAIPRRVAAGNFTPRPSQNRTYASRHIRLVSPYEGCRLPSGPAAPPVSRWPIGSDADDPLPSLRGHYPTSPLLWRSPSKCSAWVLSPRGFRRLCFSLHIGATGSCSSARKPASASRPLYAGRRLPSNQAPDRTRPKVGV